MPSEILGRGQKSSEFGGEGKLIRDAAKGVSSEVRSGCHPKVPQLHPLSRQYALHPYSRHPRASTKLTLLSCGNYRRLDD